MQGVGRNGQEERAKIGEGAAAGKSELRDFS